MPLVVAWLLGGALFFTIRMKFVNLFYFKHALDLIRGKFDDKKQIGEVSHFQALTTALSATVGLGNIAGVAIGLADGMQGRVNAVEQPDLVARQSAEGLTEGLA